MRIINLKAENIKKLTAIDITPASHVVYVTGKNGAGKSSVLDCITMALCGARGIPLEPLKKGTRKGTISLEIGGEKVEYEITRSFTKNNTYLKIESTDGRKIDSPQKFLDQLVGAISFDPLDFINQNDDKAQRKIFLDLIGINTDGIDAEEKRLRSEREIAGRLRKTAKAKFEGLVHYPEITDNLTPMSDLTKKLQFAMDANALRQKRIDENEKKKEEGEEHLENIRSWTNEILALEKKIADSKAAITDLKESYKEERDAITLLAVHDIESIHQEMNSLTDKNDKINANVLWESAKSEATQAEGVYADLTDQIEKRVQERQALLTDAKIPIPDLSFDEDGLLFCGIPLNQASDGEKLMVSLSISMALNPTLKVLRIKDGSLLDSHNRAILEKVVADKDYQLWFESVQESAKVGIYIEEGEIVSIDGKEVEHQVKKEEDPPAPESETLSEDSKPIIPVIPEEVEGW